MGTPRECPFCKIVSGEERAYIVYQASRAIAFLDKFPVEKGHVLVCPTDHYENLLQTPDDVLCEVIRLVKAVATSQMRALGAKGVRIVQNNGRAAGQEVFHVHFHVIPFYGERAHGRRPLEAREAEEVSQTLSQELRSYLAKS